MSESKEQLQQHEGEEEFVVDQDDRERDDEQQLITDDGIEALEDEEMEDPDADEAMRQYQKDDEEQRKADAQDDADAAADGDAPIEIDDDDEEQKTNTDDTTTTATKTLKRPLSAYFLFAQSVRSSIIADLDAAAAAEAAASGAEVKTTRSIAVVGKIVGEKWKVMTDEEKEPFNVQAKIAKDAYDAAVLADPSLKAKPVSKNGGGGSSSEFVIPISRVKKIIGLDSEHGKVNKVAVELIEKSTEQFLVWVAEKAHAIATKQKRKTIKSSDIESLVLSNSLLEFLRVPLKKDFELYRVTEAVQSEARKERMHEMQEQRKKKQKNEAGEAVEVEHAEGEGEEEKENATEEEQQQEESKENTSEASPSKKRKSTAAISSKQKAAAAATAKPSRTIDSMFKRVV